MNTDLTINSLALKQRWSDKTTGSSRIETSRGANLPTEMTIRHTTTKNKDSGLMERRSVVRVDRTVASGAGGGQLVTPYAYLVVVVPSDTGVVSSDITELVDEIHDIIDGAALNLATPIFVNQEQ